MDIGTENMNKIYKIKSRENYVLIQKNIPYRLPIDTPYGYMISIGLSETLMVGIVIVAKGRKLDGIINGECKIEKGNLMIFIRVPKIGWCVA